MRPRRNVKRRKINKERKKKDGELEGWLKQVKDKKFKNRHKTKQK